MQFSFALIAASAIAFVSAQPIITNTAATLTSIKAGTPVNITWSGASGPVTLTLKNGPATVLKTVNVIASGQTGTSYLWTPSTSLVDDTYALQIDDSTNVPNYSIQFAITGGVASSAVSSGSSTASSTGSSSTSSASSASTTGSSTGSMTTTSGMTSTGSSSSASRTGSSTTGSTSSSRTGSATTTASASSTSAPGNSSSANSIASPLALVLLAFAALVTLN